jgi:hypothetical protein
MEAVHPLRPMPTLQIVAALHQYPSASELPTVLQFFRLYLPSRQSTDHPDSSEDLLFGSTQMSGLQDISLLKTGPFYNVLLTKLLSR